MHSGDVECANTLENQSKKDVQGKCNRLLQRHSGDAECVQTHEKTIVKEMPGESAIAEALWRCRMCAHTWENHSKRDAREKCNRLLQRHSGDAECVQIHRKTIVKEMPGESASTYRRGIQGMQNVCKYIGKPE